MTTIEQGDVFTLINVFTVKPEHQQQLVELLIEATKEAIMNLPGFISANLHQSADGRYVVNYAQWSSSETYDAMLRHPASQPHMQAAAQLAESYNPILCRVVETMSTKQHGE